jgi:integral membrane sensor domain MASE1
MIARHRISMGRLPRLALVAGLMFLLAAGIELSRFSDRIASVWLANGAVLAVILRSPRRDWLALLAAAGALAEPRRREA